MLILITGILVMFAIIFFRKRMVDLQIVFSIVSGISMACLIACAAWIASERYIDEEIQMYVEENTNIEKQVDLLVDQYMDFETDTYMALQGEGSIALVSLYPELKSNELVSEQINIYVWNNEKIKELKTEQIHLKNMKFMLYFGGGK